MLLACFLLTASDAGSKLLTQGYPLGQIVFVRAVVLLVMLAPIAPRYGGWSALRPQRARPHLVRALLFVAATFLYLWSLKLLPLPVVAAVVFISPLLVTVLAPWLLGESGSGRGWLAVVLGLAGALLVLKLPTSGWSAAAAVPLAAAAAGALRDLSTRAAAKTESSLSIVLTTTVATVIISAATLPFGWTWPSAADSLLMLAVGIGQGIAYVAQVRSYALTTAARATTLKYSTIIWAFLFGALVFGETPDAGTLAGVALVVASGLLLLRAGNRARQQQRS